MNKLISTKERVFMCVCGSSGTGKTQLILSMLSTPTVLQGVFQPPFEHIVYIYRYWQPVYYDFLKNLGKSVKVEFKCCIQSKNLITNTLNNSSGASNEENCVDDLILSELHAISEKHSNIGYPQKKKLLIFDDCGEEVMESKAFATLATAGRHKNISTIFIKHNLYQQGRYSVTIDKGTTHIVLTKSPRIGKQLKILGSELDTATPAFLNSCYKHCMRVPFGHFLIDLTPTCPDSLRFCTYICNTTVGSKKDILISSDTQSKQRRAVSGGSFANETDDQCQLSFDSSQKQPVPRRGDCTHFFLSFQQVCSNNFTLHQNGSILVDELHGSIRELYQNCAITLASVGKSDLQNVS